MTTISGDIVAQIPSDYVTDSEMTTISCDIVAQIPSDYYTTGEVDTISGALSDEIDSDITTHQADYLDGPLSPQRLTGFELSEGTTSGTGKVAAGTALLRTTDSESGALEKISLTEQDDVTITASGTAYRVVLKYNSGTPQIVLQEAMPNYTTDITLGKFWRETDNTVHYRNTGRRLNDGVAKLHKRAERIRPWEMSTDIQIADEGSKKWSITAGYLYKGINEIAFDKFNTSGEVGDAVVEDDMADNDIADWNQAGITVTFDPAGHYEITEMMAGQSFYQEGLNFIEGTVYRAYFDIKDGVGTSEVVDLEVGETFAGGQSLSQQVTSTSEWVTEGPFDFTALADTVAMRFAFDFGNNDSVLLKNFTINSVIVNTFTYVYYDGADWIYVDDQTDINVDQYNNVATGLAACNKYKCDWVFVHPGEDHVYVIYGQDNDVVGVIEASSVPNVPDLIDTFGMLIGRIIINGGTEAFEEIQMIQSTTFNTTTVAVHNDLSGLQGGTTDEYYHLTSDQRTDLTDSGDCSIHKHDDRYYTESEVTTISGDLQTNIDTRYETIYIDAATMVPCTSSGALQGTYEYSTNDIDLDYFAFDAGATKERIQFKYPMPENWDRGTIKVKFYWSSATDSTTGDTIEWAIKAGALSDDDVIDTSLGTPQVISDTLLADDGSDLQITDATPSITVAGSPALGDMLVFEIYRNTDGSDTMAEDLWLFGVWVQYKVDSSVTEW